MKRLCVLVILGAFLCLFLEGCHTVKTLSRVNTGWIGFGDMWDAIVLDDLEFQEQVW